MGRPPTSRSGLAGFRLAAAAALLLLAVTGARAQAPRPSEYEVKAAFLYNFAKFVEWPAERQASATFTIAILGEDSFGGTFDSIVGRDIRGRRLLIERLTEVPEEPVDILFISRSEARRLEQILAALEGRPVLTVSEVEGFAHRGGVVSLVVEQKKVRFEINVDAAARSRLEVSSKLLKLARVVRDGEAP
ncbi:MAG: YfiR family protein [Gemmatimonadota bacterium]